MTSQSKLVKVVKKAIPALALTSLMSILALTTFPTTKVISFTTKKGDKATFYAASMGISRPMIEVYDADSTLKEVFSDEGNDNIVYIGNGTEYRIASDKYYSIIASGNPSNISTKNLVEGDSISNFLMGKRNEFNELKKQALSSGDKK
jgi:hypothetical protein